MTDADIKVLNIILDHITKTIVASTEKILSEFSRRRPKVLPTSIKLQRARNEIHRLRKENTTLHKLLDKGVNQLQK